MTDITPFTTGCHEITPRERCYNHPLYLVKSNFRSDKSFLKKKTGRFTYYQPAKYQLIGSSLENRSKVGSFLIRFRLRLSFLSLKSPPLPLKIVLKVPEVITGKELQTAEMESAPFKTIPRSQTLKNEQPSISY